MTSSRRERELARQRAARMARRQAEAQAKRRQQLTVAAAGGGVLLLAGIIALVVFLVRGTGSKSPATAAGSPSAQPSKPASSASATTSGAVCGYTRDSSGSSGGLPPDKKATDTPTMTLAMQSASLTGDVRVALDAAHAPCTVNSFEYLAAKHFFDGTKCHRLTTSGIFVLQCGDPTGTGTGGPGYTIPDENLKGATYPAGTVAMANTGQPHTGGSQFFLVYRDTQLPPQYTPFGKVTTGLDLLQKIAAAGTANGSTDGAPKNPVVLTSVRITG